jgi:hypothetical protein
MPFTCGRSGPGGRRPARVLVRGGLGRRRQHDTNDDDGTTREPCASARAARQRCDRRGHGLRSIGVGMDTDRNVTAMPGGTEARFARVLNVDGMCRPAEELRPLEPKLPRGTR